MGRLDRENKYQNDIRRILNYRVGNPYNLLCLFIFGPFLIPLYDTLGNGIISGLRILPTLEEFLVIETIAVIILILRVLRDYFLRKKIFPIDNEKNRYIIAIKKLESLKKKEKKETYEYDEAIYRLIERNNEILNSESFFYEFKK
ncbi:hypothetical protein RJI07_08635 [Mycoplasmatota bacterium WC30]